MNRPILAVVAAFLLAASACTDDTKIAQLEHDLKKAQHELGVKKAEIGEMQKTNARLTEELARVRRTAEMATEIAIAQPSPAAQASVLAPQPTPQDELIIERIASRVTEENSSWAKHAWQLTVRNNSSRTIEFDAIVEFKDSGGFIVDDDKEYRLTLRAGETNTFSGYDLVSFPAARYVEKTSAKVRWK